MLAWTSLLLAAVTLHVGESVELGASVEERHLRALASALNNVIERDTRVDDQRGCVAPGACAEKSLERTGGDELLLVYFYGGIDRTLVVIRRVQGQHIVASEEITIAADGTHPPDWNTVVTRLFWDLAQSPDASGANLVVPVSLMGVGGASLLASAGFGVWAASLNDSTSGRVDEDLASHVSTFDTARTTSLVLLGTGLGLVLTGGLWAIVATTGDDTDE